MSRAYRLVRAAATTASGLLALAVLTVWGWSYARPVVMQFDRRAGTGAGVERCSAFVVSGRLGVDNSPARVARRERLLAECNRLSAARDALYVQRGLSPAAMARSSIDPKDVEEAMLPVLDEWQAMERAFRGACDAWASEVGASGRGSAGPDFAWCYWAPRPSLPLLGLMLALAPTVAGIRWSRARDRGRPGYCRRCGYDLRATPTAGGPMLAVCPECGGAAAAAATAGDGT